MYTIDFDLWNQIYYTMGGCITGKTSDFNNKQQYILMRSDIVVARLFLVKQKHLLFYDVVASECTWDSRKQLGNNLIMFQPKL